MRATFSRRLAASVRSSISYAVKSVAISVSALVDEEIPASMGSLCPAPVALPMPAKLSTTGSLTRDERMTCSCCAVRVEEGDVGGAQGGRKK
eukprot:c49042_g1_i1 orf=55-330(+)